MYDNVNVWDSRLTYESGLKVHFISQDLAKNEVMKYQNEYRQNGTLFIGSKGWMTLSRTYAECSIQDINEAILADVISHNTNVAIRLKKEVKWDAKGMEIKDSIEGNQLINRAHRASFA